MNLSVLRPRKFKTQNKSNFHNRHTILQIGKKNKLVNPLYDYLIYLIVWKSWKKYSTMSIQNHNSESMHQFIND